MNVDLSESPALHSKEKTGALGNDCQNPNAPEEELPLNLPSFFAPGCGRGCIKPATQKTAIGQFNNSCQ
jgi:hypothetical protein